MLDAHRMMNVVRLGRLHFLVPGVLLYVLGALTAVAFGTPLSLSRMAFGYLVFLPAHLGMHYSNDYFDYAADSHGQSTTFTGGSHVLIDHPELRPVALWLSLALIALSMLVGVLFALHYSLNLWLLSYLVLGNLLGWFYAAPPLRLAYRGLGEAATLLTLGLVMPGAGYLAIKGQLDTNLLLVTAPILFYGLSFILSVEIPDMEADRLGNKWTYVARRGREEAFVSMGVAMILATTYSFVLPTVYGHALPLDMRVIGVFSLLPLAPGVIGLVKRPTDRDAAIRIVNAFLANLLLFLLLADVYLIVLVAL